MYIFEISTYDKMDIFYHIRPNQRKIVFHLIVLYSRVEVYFLWTKKSKNCKQSLNISKTVFLKQVLESVLRIRIRDPGSGAF